MRILRPIVPLLILVAPAACGWGFLRAAAGADRLESAAAIRALQSWLKDSSRSELAQQKFARTPLTQDASAEAVRLLWEEHAARVRKERSAEMKAKVIKVGDLSMPFEYYVYGKKPSGGRSLFLSLHGGGGAPPRVNDQQWENQKRLYRPEEGVYLAPRAPTDTWNLWHQAHIDEFFARLIENLIVLENVNPNRVYLLGYSAGGDGVYQLAPRMADRWAAAAMMAGHPNDASPDSLRNVPFAIHVGELDAAYKRNEVAEDWRDKLAALRKSDPEGYLHDVQLHKGKGHWMDREDAVAVGWMAEHTRDPLPERVVWRQDDVTHRQSYWLAVDAENAQRGARILARRRGQAVELQSEDVSRITVMLNDRMADLDSEIAVTWNGRPLPAGHVERTIAAIAQSIASRGDPDMIFTAQLVLDFPHKSEE